MKQIDIVGYHAERIADLFPLFGTVESSFEYSTFHPLLNRFCGSVDAPTDSELSPSGTISRTL
jgi:hypothetical protein